MDPLYPYGIPNTITTAATSWAKFKAACEELERWLLDRIAAHGIVYECTSPSPGTMEDLKAVPGPLVPVPTYQGRPDTIYGGGGCNKCLYQAYHDHFHKHGDEAWDFTEAGEYKIAMAHMEEAHRTGLSMDAQRLLWVESYVRVHYYFKWGHFFRNEGLAHWIAWNNGIYALLSCRDI